MLAGDLYIAADAQLDADSKRARKLNRLFNATTEDGLDVRDKILRELIGEVGKNVYIEPPFHADYGLNTSIGDNFYANFDAIFVDDCPVKIGDNVMFGPRVSIYTAGHPIDATVRNEQLEYSQPITIGNNVWIGGNAVINPGVTIGDNVVIGSGSIITHSIPDNVVAVGNPCHVLREINEEDKAYWENKKKQYFEN